MDPIARCLVALVPLRMLLDLLWWVQTPVGSAGQIGSGLGFVFLLAVVVRGGARVLSHPLAWVGIPYVVWICGAAIVGGPPALAGATAIHWITPMLWIGALWLHPPASDPVEVWVWAGVLPVGIGLACGLAGQPAAHVLHGWPRLLGAYGNVHTHAGIMAVLAVSAASLGLRRGHRGFALLAAAAALCLVATFVRTAWVWAAVAAMGSLWIAGHRRIGAALAVGGLGLGLASGRLGDLVALIRWTPPPGGWRSLGSSRVHIWSDVVARFGEGDAVQWVFGRGLGGQVGLHRHFDPHSEVLTVLVQLGIGGTLVWGTLIVASLVLCWRRSEALAFGLLLGAAVTAWISNDWLTRATVSLWVWGTVGWACRSASRVRDATPPRSAVSPPG